LLNRVSRIERDRTKMLVLRLCEIPIAVLPILIYLSTFVFEKIIVTMISIGPVIFLVIPITAILMLLPLFPCATRTGINATLSITLALTLVILVVQFFGSTFIASQLFSPKPLNNSNGTIEDYSVLHNYSLGIIDQGHGNYWLNQWHINTIIYYQALGIAAFFLPIILGFWLSLCSGRCRIDRHSTQLLAPCITRLCACLLPQEEIRETVNAQQQAPIVIPRTRRINRDRGERIRSILSEDGFFRVDVDSYPMLMEGTARSTASSRQPVDQLFNDLQTNNNLSK